MMTDKHSCDYSRWTSQH